MTRWFFLATMTPMFWSRLFLSLLFLTPSAFAAKATNPQQAFLEQFASSRLTFPPADSPYFATNPGRYPSWMLWTLTSALGWTPSGQGHSFADKCSPALWSQRLQDPRISSSVQLQGALVQKYMQQCEQEITTGPESTSLNSLRMMSMKYEPQTHPFLRRVVLDLPGHIKLKGLLGLKGDLKKRPFVILRLGVFSNVEEFLPERAWVMMLFEQSPFNILVVENTSSSDFIADNSHLAFGGYDEGLQNILIAKMLADPQEPLHRLIDSVHIFGMSLGGHGALFASLLSDLNSAPGHPLIQSVIGMCPVVDLQSAMENVTGKGILGFFADFWSQHRLKQLNKVYPAVEKASSGAFLQTVISEMAQSYQGGLSYTPDIHLPAGLKNDAGFWAVNNYWKYYKQSSVPVLIFATKNDPIVPFASNSQLLMEKQIKIESNNIKVVAFDQGVHCTLPIPYDWKAISSLLQAYVLSHSPHFKLQEQSLEMAITEEWPLDNLKSAVKTSFHVDWPDGKKNYVTLYVKAENEQGQQTQFNFNLPVSQFDYTFLNNEIGDSERAMLGRWLQQNLSVAISRQKDQAMLKIAWPVAAP